MTTNYFVRIPKADVKLKKVSDFTTGIFIDNSGSTGSVLPSTNKTILQAELSICQSTQFNHVVLWDTSAELCQNIQSAQPRGGTNPTCIFQNTTTKEAFRSSDVIVFVTDGEIDSHSVTQFSTFTKDNLDKALIICVITNRALQSPSQINISVVAPLMLASNVLCLFYDGTTFYILASKGYISQFYPSPADLSSYEGLKTLNLENFFQTIKIFEHQKLPDGTIPIRDDENEIIAIDYNQFLNTTDLNLLSEINEDDWKVLIQYGKIGNKLDELRTFVSQMKNQAIQNQKDTCQAQFNFQYSNQRDEIISKIIELKLNENENLERLTQLRQQLHQISDQAKIEQIEYVKYVNANLHKSRAYWNTIQNLIHEQEIGSYSINDFTFSSNRANRAKVLTETDDEYSDTIDILDHTNVPLFECAICTEQAPILLWLKSPTNLDDTTNDFIINFPLNGNANLANCFVSNPVCGYCAKSYTNTFKDNLLTLYRVPCSGFIPLNWSVESNRKFAQRALYRILTDSRMLPHVSMLFFSMVDDCQMNWIEQQTKDFVLNELLQNIWTTDTFSEEGIRMKFQDALKGVIKQEDKLLRQPFQAVRRILKLNSIYNQLDRETSDVLLRKRFAVLCIENQCSKTKFGPEHLAKAKQDIYDMIFDTLCGIPLQNSFKQIDIHNEQFKDFFGKSYEFILQIPDYSAIFSPEIISFILFLLTTVQVHDRPMKIYTDFCLKHRPLRENMQINWSEFVDTVNQTVFGNYHSCSLSSIPGYAIYVGKFSCPSKFFFFTKALWSPSIDQQLIDISTLMNQIKGNLDAELKVFFGNSTPNSSSAHLCLHSTVASILEEQYPNANEINEEIIMNCLIALGRTAGRKGNIYADVVFPSLVLTIDHFLKFRRTTRNRLVANDENISRSYQHKILSELIACGMEYNEETKQIRFESEKLPIPKMLDLTTNQFDFDQLKKSVQKLYVDSKAKVKNDQNQSCFTIEIKDFIEFGYKLDADALLPIWAQEQSNIVSSIVVDRDEIEQPIKYIAGLDISFVKTNDKAVASMVIFEYSTLTIVAKLSVNCNMKIPYIAGYLAFREAPVFLKLLDIQQEHCPHLTPQVILMDGCGVWHPRRAGIASHFSVLSGIPCFGVSKNVLFADGVTREKIEDLLKEKAPNEDQFVEIHGDSGYLLGLAYNVTGFIKNAVYLSAGHKITLSTALQIFKTVTKYRNCEPIRQADLLSRELVAKLA